MAVAFLIAIGSTAYTGHTQAAQAQPTQGQEQQMQPQKPLQMQQGQGQQAVPSYPLNLPKQSLAAALNTLSEQTDIQVLFPYDIARSHSIGPLQGNFTIEQALVIMLRNTGLHGGLTQGGIIAIAPADNHSGTNQYGKGKKMNTYTRKTLLASMVGLFAAGGASGSLAQGGEAATEQGRIDEIIVTATKREESLNDVPISISVVSDEVIENLGAKNLQEIVSGAPNVNFPDDSTSDWGNTIAIRGAYTPIQFLGMNSSTGVYLDGIFMGKNDAFNFGSGDLERVEILRGPQGTLFGKNTTGGAINMVTKKPSQELEGGLKVEVGNYDHADIGGSLNVPISDKLAARFSVNNTDRDGYAKNLTTGSDLGTVDSTSWRAQFLYTATENTDIRFVIDGLDSQANFLSGETLPPVGDGVPYTFFHSVDPVVKKEGEGIALTIEHQFDSGHTLTSITSRRENNVDVVRDIDSTASDGLVQRFESSQENISQELRIASPAGQQFDYVLGLYYFDQKFLTSEFFDFGPAFGGDVGERLLGAVHNLESTSYATFVHSNFHFSEATTAFAGLRYTNEDQSIDSQASGVPFWVSVFNVDINPRQLDFDSNNVSWIVGLRHNISDNAMIYGSVSRGAKAGAFNTSPLTPNGVDPRALFVDDEFVTSYELGTKTTWLDGRLGLNGAIFYMDYTDYQVLTNVASGTLPDGTTLFTSIFDNAAALTSQGVELEIVAAPTEGLRITSGIAYLDATFDKYEGASDPEFGIVDASGNQNPISPEWTFNLAIDYERELSNVGSLVANLNYDYKDRFFSGGNLTNHPDGVSPSLGRLGGRIGFRSNEGQWGVFLWGKNLTDEDKPIERSVLGFGGNKERYVVPRTYGLSVNYQF
ncbi:TonB-dependent receptor [SAR92 clade bacterium H231]|nr:TonB-dependent receptor [SAR92 clade bacterium H231]